MSSCVTFRIEPVGQKKGHYQKIRSINFVKLTIMTRYLFINIKKNTTSHSEINILQYQHLI